MSEITFVFRLAASELFVRLFHTDVSWLGVVSRALSRFCVSLFLQPDDFAHNVFVFHGGVAAFVHVAILSHSEVLLVFFPASSENQAVACSREILVFSHLLYSYRFVFVKKFKEIALSRKKLFEGF